MNGNKNSGLKDPFKELSFFISPGLKYLSIDINLWKCKIKMNALFAILKIGYIVIYRCIQRERERERESPSYFVYIMYS